MFWLGFITAFVVLGLISIVSAIIQIIKLKINGHKVENGDNNEK